MANQQEPVVPSKQDPKAAAPGQVTPDWEKILYSTDRVQKWLKGELTLQELNAINGPEMLSMAMVGFQLYEQGRLDDAEVIFSGLNALDPRESYYLTALGAVHLAKEDLDMALRCFNQAIKLNNKEIASYVNRGEVHLRQGKILEAAEDFKSAVDLDPKGTDPLTHRARVLAAAALEMIEQAQKGDDGASEKKAKPAAAPSKKGSAPAKAAKKK
ncbi:MAG: Tetratricopeptide repeat protein [Myxococcaceae bacterium]|nr:Tetratricopeptide repeat protein [Myxococcaceae bacterium]